MARYRIRIAWILVSTFLLTLCGPGICEEAASESSPALGIIKEEQSAPHDQTARVWIELTDDGLGESTTILVHPGEGQPENEQATLRCEIVSAYGFESGYVTLEVIDAEGTLVDEGALDLTVEQGITPFAFTWDARGAAPGEYTARLQLMRPPHYLVASRDVVVKKKTCDALSAALDQAIADLEAVQELFAGQEEGFPYARMRLIIAGRFVEPARKAFETGDWQRVERLAHHMESTAKATRAELTFGYMAPERTQKPPHLNLERLEARDGIFYADGHPVFLMGVAGHDDLTSLIPELAEQGLNFVAFGAGPCETLGGDFAPLDFAQQLDPVFACAKENNVAVAFSLNPNIMGDWVFDQAPDVIDSSGSVNLVRPLALKVAEAHVKALGPYLAEQPMLGTVGILQRPALRFEGEDVRQGFIERTKAVYSDRHTVNQSWKAIFADLDEIEVGWVDTERRYQESPAYQYDWQSYHRELATNYITWLAGLTQAALPGVPLAMASADNVFEPRESCYGIDRETLAGTFDVSGCCVTSHAYDPFYAMGYPHQVAIYALLKSFAPDKPICNMENRLFGPNDILKADNSDYVYGLLWDSVIAGLNGSAVDTLAAESAGFDVWAHPACIEAYAEAALDINRLAPIIAAFQQAPAYVAILWSPASKILSDGDPFLRSAVEAYEGCSFSGFKVRYVTEEQCTEEGLAGIKTLVMPNTPALDDEAFPVIKGYIEDGGIVVRTPTPVSYDERGHSRRDIITNTPKTVLVRGKNLPTEYLHAMDAVTTLDGLPLIPRTINHNGYPLEGVKSQYVEIEGQGYLYILNLRKHEAICELFGSLSTGRDLIKGRDVTFPMVIEPLDPFLIRLDMSGSGTNITAVPPDDAE